MDPVTAEQSIIRRTLVDTRSPEEARQEIGRIFCPHFLAPSARHANGFHAVHRSSRQRDYSLNVVSYGTEVDIDPGELSNFFLLQIPVAGSAMVRCGKDTACVEAGRSASFLSPTLPTRMRWSGDCEKLIVLIAREAMQKQCEQIVGRPVDRVEFATGVDTTSDAGRQLLGHVRLMREATEIESGIFGDYLARLGESLTTLLLMSLSHSQRRVLEVAATPAGSAVVARAEAWILANIERSFSVADIAEAAGTSLRSLQEGVRRQRGTTLTQMIETVRLEHFRAALQDPGTSRSVTEIAYMAGLGHLGRAAAAYRRRYGETPSETLRRTRQR
ncbi:AraC family transcriptional regulator [Pseudaminobacter soli (ex Li et al. 2025)]|uniref:AraC family transcriptional regulator n=1 Tax=Pseudaminobacter soli (ex Li et al. 2025) TaxID=1295366 RepID=A0A2P7SK46_9HYPH|nr:AraC family transcriptional regulator [Mesorhizobium soli]PSJ62854.1 AraC family transcriptional regulator [Mesorhizobium soli]